MNQTPRMGRRSSRWILPAGVVVFAVTLILYGFQPSTAAEWIQSLGAWAPVFYVLAGTMMMTFLVPKTAVSITAGALFGWSIGSLVMLITAVIAAGFNYSLGRWWLHRSVATKTGPRWTAIRNIATDAGLGTHILFRLTPIPTSAISYTMGAAGAKRAPFLAAAAIGVIPQWLWVQCGAAAISASEQKHDVATWASLTISVAAAIILSLLIPKIVAKQMKLQKIDIDQP